MKLTTLCYLEDGEKILFLYRNKKENDIHEGKHIGLGGKMEAGESPVECIAREVFEESGLKLEETRLRGIMTFPKFDGVEDWYTFLFSSTRFSGSLTDSDEGELMWVNRNKIEELSLWEGDKLFLSWMREYDFFSAKLIYRGGVLREYHLEQGIELVP